METTGAKRSEFLPTYDSFFFLSGSGLFLYQMTFKNADSNAEHSTQFFGYHFLNHTFLPYFAVLSYFKFRINS